MHQSLVKFSESEASNHTPSLADFTTTTPELKFSVHTPLSKTSVRSTIETGFSAKVQKCAYRIKKAAGSIAGGLPGSKLIPRMKHYSDPARFKLEVIRVAGNSSLALAVP